MSTWLTPGDDLAPVARFLGITPERAADPDIAASLELCVATAVEQIEERVGPLVTKTVTETVTARRGWAGLTYQPTVVQSASTGTTRRIVGYGLKGDFPDGDLTVTYATGWAPDAASVPVWARTAGLLMCRHLWTTQLGNQRANVSTADTPGAAWLWPRQVEALIAGRELAPRIA